MAQPQMIYQLKITLFDTLPKIWRRILIPTSATFWDLHSAIQDAFHWNNSHQHLFIYDDKIFKKAMLFGFPSVEDGMETYPSWKHKMSKYLNLEEPCLKYIYDLGDEWIHKIELENILPAEKEVTYPVCTGGKQNSPPDDCGGVHGYENMLEVLSDPTDEEYAETREWVDSMKGGPLDPEHFNPREVEFMNPKQRYKESFE